MSISFTATQLRLIVLATEVVVGAENEFSITIREDFSDLQLIYRAFGRFEKELLYYESATVKTGLLPVVRKYHRLLINTVNDYQTNWR